MESQNECQNWIKKYNVHHISKNYALKSLNNNENEYINDMLSYAQP